MKRESPGIDNFLRDQGSKFPSLLGSGIKILPKISGSFTKTYTSLRPDLNFNLKARNLMSGKASFIIRSCQVSWRVTVTVLQQ